MGKIFLVGINENKSSIWTGVMANTIRTSYSHEIGSITFVRERALVMFGESPNGFIRKSSVNSNTIVLKLQYCIDR